MDVVVNISNTLAAVRRKDFGRTLILTSTDPSLNCPKDTMKIYEDLSDLAKDWPETTNAYKAAQALFSQIPRVQDVAILDVTRDATNPTPTELSSALNTLLDGGGIGTEWYFLVYADREPVPGDRDELNDWIGAQERIYLASSFQNETVADLVAAASTYVQNRTFIFAHDAAGTDDDEFFDAAFAGRVGAKYPGSVNWRHLMLNGISEPGYTATERATLENGNVMTYWKNPVGLLVTTGGMATSGFWGDLQRAIDYLVASIRERIWDALSQKDKIPYDDTGIQYLASLVIQALEIATGDPYYIVAQDLDGNGLYQVRPPRRKDIDPLDVKNRILPNLPFVATAAGAINKVVVNGILTEEYIEPMTGEYTYTSS